MEEGDLFFENRTYNRDIVDVLFQATARTLNVNLIIYQNSNDHIQAVKIRRCTSKNIYLEYSHSQQSPQYSQCDAVNLNVA